MDQDVEQLSLEDVYDLASTIGKEFQMVMDTWGSDVVTNLMPKVVCILQYLEMNCLKKHSTEDELASLKLQIDQLEQDKSEKAEHRLRFEKELENIEEMWRKENAQLQDAVKELKDENQRLSSIVSEKEAVITAVTSGVEANLCAKESITQLQEELRKTCIDLKNVRQLLESTSSELEKAKDQIGLLNKELQETKKQMGQVQLHNQILTEEKSELEVDIEEKTNEIKVLRNKLKVAVEDNLDLSSLVTPEKSETTPRFSLKELRNIIIERNSLKSRLSEVEDELAVYKRPVKVASVVESCNFVADDGDRPVQGPINREPLDKLFPERRQSKILKFFPSLSWNKLQT